MLSTKNMMSIVFILSTRDFYGYSDSIANIQREHEEIEGRLRTEEIVSNQHFSSFLKKQDRNSAQPSHPIRLITLKSGLQGVFKKGRYHYAEVAGYRASKALGFHFVPPTVYRTIEGVTGSLQLFINAPDLKKKELRNKIFSELDPQILNDMKLFNYVFGRWDARGGNLLAVPSDKGNMLVLIDNSSLLHRTYQRYGSSAFVSQGENMNVPSPCGDVFPYDSPQKISGATVESVFEPYLQKKRINKYKKRDSLSYVIWNHRLYIEHTKHSSSHFTHEISQQTFEALHNLRYEVLQTVWHELQEVSPELAQDLIQLTLERRDEVLSYFKHSQGLMS